MVKGLLVVPRGEVIWLRRLLAKVGMVFIYSHLPQVRKLWKDGRPEPKMRMPLLRSGASAWYGDGTVMVR